MKALLFAACVALLTLSAGDADAARLGGGKSVGMQRQAVTPKPAAPPQQAAPAPTAPTPASAPAPAPKRNWLGPLAGLAAGLGIAALLAHFGLGAELANFLLIALLAVAAFAVFKLLFRRKSDNGPEVAPLQYAGAGNAGAPPPLPQTGSGATAGAEAPPLPDGFDARAFLDVAKSNFVRLQAANDARDVDSVRDFLSPELFAEIRLQMLERGDAPQQTDVVTLNAELLELSSQARRHIASVRFSGMIRETPGAAAQPFAEVWHLSKPDDGTRGWVLAGIQQAD